MTTLPGPLRSFEGNESHDYPRVGCVIVYYSAPDLLRDTLSALMAGTEVPSAIVIVDNDSELPVPDDLQRKFPVLQLEQNGGYAAAVNHGIRALRDDHGIGQVLVLTHETTVAGECLRALRLAHDSAGLLSITAPILDRLDHPGALWSSGGKFRWDGVPVHQRVAQHGAALIQTDWADGAALFFSVLAWEEVEGFEEGYFLYFEEVDFCRRVLAIKGSVWIAPRARASQAPGGQPPRLKLRNGYYFHRVWSPPKVLLPWILSEFVRAALRRPGQISEMVHGLRQGAMWHKQAGYPRRVREASGNSDNAGYPDRPVGAVPRHRAGVPRTILDDWREELPLLSAAIGDCVGEDGMVRVLEAGCGQQWPIRMPGLKLHVTGVDADAEAMELRKSRQGDLDVAIVGDLRSVQLPTAAFDVAYCSFVLEHVAGAALVLDRLRAAVREGGRIVIRVPDRQSVYGATVRLTPHWMHVLFKKYAEGYAQAGSPGHPPYRTVYDEVVSIAGLREFAAVRRMTVLEEYGTNMAVEHLGRFRPVAEKAMRAIAAVSRGRLTATHQNICVVLQVEKDGLI